MHVFDLLTIALMGLFFFTGCLLEAGGLQASQQTRGQSAILHLIHWHCYLNHWPSADYHYSASHQVSTDHT